MSEGLAQLASRGRRTRDIPPPRNPARSEPVSLPGTSQAKAEHAAAPTSSQVPEEARRTLPSLPKSAPTATAAPEPSPDPALSPTAAKTDKVKPALKVVTVYLEQDDDDFLETITHTGRTTQPKTAISRSAVVRLALERLNAQMSPDEVVNELRPRGSEHGTGRKRR